MILTFIIWSIVAGSFCLIGISTWKAKEEAGFFTFSKPAKMMDVTKYNHAVGKLWFFFAAVLEFIGIPFLYTEQNSPIVIFIILEVMVLVIVVMIKYMRIEKKYRTQTIESKRPEPPLDNLPTGAINWDEISEFIEDMLNPDNRGNKGWKIIHDGLATAKLQENSVMILKILYDDLYGYFYTQYDDRFEVWNRIEKYIRIKYGKLSDKALSRIITTYHIDDR